MNSDLVKAIDCLQDAHSRSTQGRWMKGATTHHTIVHRSDGSPYDIAEFHHADDANFCDQSHEYVPVVVDALIAATNEVKRLQAVVDAIQLLVAPQ